MKLSYAAALTLLPALALGHTLRGAWLERAFEARLSRVPAFEAPAVRPEVAQAHDDLLGLMAWLPELSAAGDSPVFAFGAWPEADVEELSRGVAEREPFFAAVEALPAALWELDHAPLPPLLNDPYDPSDWGQPRLLALMNVANAYRARALLRSREGANLVESGRDLARALAIARVTDRGTTYGLMLRVAVEASVLETLGALLGPAPCVPEPFWQPLEAELRRALGQDRVALALDLDLLTHLGYLRWTRERASPLHLWLVRPTVAAGQLRLLDLFEHCRAPRPVFRLLGTGVALPDYGSDGPSRVLWTEALGESARGRNARLAALLP